LDPVVSGKAQSSSQLSSGVTMSNQARFGALTLAALAFGLVAGIVYDRSSSGLNAQEPAAVMAGRYTVVDTEGTNIIVTDNKTNVLYFYTIDKDKEIGSDLKLRGSLDLNNVGKEVLSPKVLWGAKKEEPKQP